MKSYIASMGYRQIPVGYSAADVEENRYDMATYMNCGTDDQRSDFFAFNDYSWCDPDSSFQISGWDQKVKQYSGYSIPLFLSEFGCITNARNFQEIATLYSSKMTSVYSGGLVYEYSEEGSGYGLVNIQGNSISETSDFKALQQALAKTQPSGDGGYKENGSPSKCPQRSHTWEVSKLWGRKGTQDYICAIMSYEMRQVLRLLVEKPSSHKNVRFMRHVLTAHPFAGH